MHSITYIFLFCFVMRVFGECATECVPNQGACINNKCVCRVFFQGDDCSISWKTSYEHWNLIFLVYRIYVGVFFLALTLTCLVEFSKLVFISYTKKTKLTTIVTYVLIGLFIGCATRLIQFIIDPHNYNAIVGTEADGFLYSFPILLWIDCGFLILLYWIELVSHSKLVELLFVQKLRIPLIAFAIITALLLIPISIINVLYRTVLINSLYNATVGLILLALIFVTIYSGSRFIRVVNQVWQTTREPHFREFLKRTTYSIFAIAIFMIVTIVAAALFPFFALTNAWWFLGLHFILRTSECGSVVCLLVVIIKKKPPKETKSRHNSKESTEIQHMPTTSDEPLIKEVQTL